MFHLWNKGVKGSASGGSLLGVFSFHEVDLFEATAAKSKDWTLYAKTSESP